MREKLRKTAIDIIGDVPWGTHFCLFYQSKEDLIDILVPYFKAGLQNNEFCMWITSEPLNVEETKKSLKQVVDNLDDYIGSGQIEILDYSQWYTKSGMFEGDKVLQGWLEKHDKAVKRGFDGLRFAGNISWLKKRDWKNFLDYEAMVESVIRKYRMLAICTYSLDKCKASEIIDVVSVHQIAIIKKQDRWQPIESSERKQAQQKIQEALQYADKIIETVREPFLVLDKNLKVVSANDYFYEAFNVKPEDTDGQFIYNLGNRQWDIPELRELLHEILPKKNSFKNFEVKHDFPNIGPKRMLLNASQVDEVQLILLAIEDITGIKKAEEKSRQSHECTENIFNYSNVPIIFWDKELKIIRFNHAFEHLTGYTANEVIGQRLSMLFPEATRDASLNEIENTMKGKHWDTVEIPILCKGGDIRIVLWNSANIYAEDGTTLLSTIAQGVDITELKNREEELKESEQRFRRIFEEVTDGIILADTETKKFYFGNKTIYQMLGYNEEEIKGLGIMDIHPQEALPYVLEQVEKQIRREIALAKDLPVKRKDGSVFYADVNTATITLAGKAYLMGIFRDVTERKKAEKTQKQLIALIEATPDFVGFADAKDKHIIYVNKAGRKMCGIGNDEDVTKLKISDVHPEWTNKMFAEEILPSAVRDGVWTGECAFLNIRDRHEIPVLMVLSSHKASNGEVEVFSTISRDVTERKKAEEALKESKERLELALSAASMGTWRWNIKTDQDTRDANFNSILGLKAAESTQSIKEFIQYVHPDDRAVVDEEIKRAIRERDIYRIEFRIVRPDGTIYWLSDRGKVYYDQKNEPAYMTGAVFNITERKKAEEALQQLNKDLESTVHELNRSNQEIEDFAHVIAHNLKSPLRAVGTLADWIATDYSDKLNQEGKEQIKLLKGRVTRMSELIDSVLWCSEIRCVSNQREKVNLNTLVTETIDRIAPPESIEITIENELPTLICEKAHLAEVFQNLLSNAVKYMDKPQGRIRIGCVEEDDFWKFSIADNGPGIKEQHFERIFKIFQTLLPCDELGSTGIGLTVVKKIVELYGGRIWVESKPPEGSTFFFTLPKQEKEITGTKLQATVAS